MLKLRTHIFEGTQAIALAPLKVDGREVILVDTPGFDDGQRTDAQILNLLAEWLKTTYDANTYLNGLIMLQQANADRFTGSEQTRTRMFEMICGPDAFEHVVIATTMWDKIKTDDLPQWRELVRQRKADQRFWGDMCSRGAEVVEHNNTQQSALSIVRKLMQKDRVVLGMQIELARNGGRVGKTSAGEYLNSALGEKLALVEAELEEMRMDRRALMLEIASLKQLIENLRSQQSILNSAQVCFPNF